MVNAITALIIADVIVLFFIGMVIPLMIKENSEKFTATITRMSDSLDKSQYIISEQNKTIEQLKASIDSFSAYKLQEDCLEDDIVTAEEHECSLNYETMELPEGRTNTYRFMDYTSITDTSSLQWSLQQKCYTDTNTGIRCIDIDGNKYFVCAMSTRYAKVGDCFRVTLQNGSEFYVICGDMKDPGDANHDLFGHKDVNYDGEQTTNIIEFITESQYVSSVVKNTGSYSALEFFGGLFGSGGDIVELQYIDFFNWR